MGNGVVGPLTMANNSSFLMSDTWYEGTAIPTDFFQIPNENFAYLGGHLAVGSHGGTQTVPPILQSRSTATASWIGLQFDLTNTP